MACFRWFATTILKFLILKKEIDILIFRKHIEKKDFTKFGYPTNPLLKICNTFFQF